MVSVATKISMFTMFSTMSLTNAMDAGQTLTEVLAALQRQVDDLTIVKDAYQDRIFDAEMRLLDIED